jgi:hypothetical protein
MKQASFASSSVHGGGKRRAVEMRLRTRAQSFSTGIGYDDQQVLQVDWLFFDVADA